MCTRIYHWHYHPPLVPSVLSTVRAEMGPTFCKLQNVRPFVGCIATSCTLRRR